MIHIHKGFNDIYNKIKDKIFSSISPNVKKIVICGYSMGASLGFIFALDASLKYETAVYGMAAPRTGNIKFVKTLIERCRYSITLINLADVVPTLHWTYSFNLIPPYNPVNFAHVTPIAIFINVLF